MPRNSFSFLPKTRLVASLFAVAYWLGHQRKTDIPSTVDATMGLGHDGLNWQLFVPLAEDLLGELGVEPVDDES